MAKKTFTNKEKANLFGNSKENWGVLMEKEMNAKMRARTPKQIAVNAAANLLLKSQLNAIRKARVAAERERAIAEAIMKRSQEIAAAHIQWARENAAERAMVEEEYAHAVPTARHAAVGALASAVPRKGKVMKECRTNNAGHLMPKGMACKFVHKDEPEYAMLRPDQKRADGGFTRKIGGRNIHVVPSPPALSNVNTYTSWPGGVDPTAPLYNQRTMLGGRRRTRRN
jgi:hypothetical protein